MVPNVYRDALKKVFDLCFLDEGPEGEFYNPDKELDSGHLADIPNAVRALFEPIFEMPSNDELYNMSDRCFSYLATRACPPSVFNKETATFSEELRHLSEIYLRRREAGCAHCSRMDAVCERLKAVDEEKNAEGQPSEKRLKNVAKGADEQEDD